MQRGRILENGKRIKLAAWLMSLSILLLVLFQAYWLRQTYTSEFNNLRRELGLIFRETSLRRQMTRYFADSTATWPPRYEGQGMRSMTIIKAGSDTSSQPASGATVAVTINADTFRLRSGSSSQRIMGFDATERREAEARHQGRLVVMAPLPGPKPNLDSLSIAYRKALDENDFSLGFTMKTLSRTRSDGTSDSVRMHPGSRGMMSFSFEMAEAYFDNPFWLILSKMGWPISFAVMMLAITVIAFVFLFRNLKAQHRLAVLKNDFIANITHELKTPIATVGVAIEALRNFNAINDPARTREYLDISSVELQRLSLLVDKVLKLSMFEQDVMEFSRTPVDLKRLLEDVLHSMRLQVEKAGAAVTIDAPDSEYTIRGDSMHLMSVLYNLLDNALKYSAGNPKVSVHLARNAGMITLSVEDNGIGIPAEYRQRVFDKFFRVPHGDTHNTKGYGLGLSYVAEVVRRHGGTIAVKSAPEKGSIFTLEFPANA
jgi:two-component system phosphate regulon sensor histidine kinase PhoR